MDNVKFHAQTERLTEEEISALLACITRTLMDLRQSDSPDAQGIARNLVRALEKVLLQQASPETNIAVNERSLN